MRQIDQQSDSVFDEESDLENQLEEYMRQGVEGLPRERDDSNMSRLESQYAENKVLSNLVALPNIDTKATKERMDGIFQVTAGKLSGNKGSGSRVSD